MFKKRAADRKNIVSAGVGLSRKEIEALETRLMQAYRRDDEELDEQIGRRCSPGSAYSREEFDRWNFIPFKKIEPHETIREEPSALRKRASKPRSNNQKASTSRFHELSLQKGMSLAGKSKPLTEDEETELKTLEAETLEHLTKEDVQFLSTIQERSVRKVRKMLRIRIKELHSHQ